MLFPDNIEQKLGFDIIRELLIGNCSTSLGVENVDKIKFSTNADHIIKMIQQTEELHRILTASVHFPTLVYREVSHHLEHIKIPGSYADSHLVKDIYLSLISLSECHTFFKKYQVDYPVTAVLFKDLEFDQSLFTSIERVIDENGEMRPNATPELRKITESIRKHELQARRRLEVMISETKKKGYTPEDTSLTIRSGRLVIPVKAEYKRKIRGFIHDESSTGSTSYIEPSEVLELNNEVRELEYSRQREIIKILIQLADDIRPYIPFILRGFKSLGLVDLIKAKARLGIKLDFTIPKLGNGKKLEWLNARHPLLEMSHKKQDKPVIPLTVTLHADQRILIVSGPNAGGKSVCLKTIGLLQYMYQCGIPVPLGEGSTMRIFNDIFIDIGDEQSIEDDLSTYSSHLVAMKKLLESAGKGTLFLIDEFGTGTDPQFGGAIAEAILFELIKQKAYGVVTTHYGNLKKLAQKMDGVENARMRYDISRLEPLYLLEIGKPGSSFALEIARKTGLPEIVLKNTRKNVGVDQVQLDQLLHQLEQEKSSLEAQNKKLAENKRKLDESLKTYQELKDGLQTKRKEIIDKAKDEAQGILTGANRKVEAVIREIKESDADKAKTKVVRAKLEDHKKSLKIKKKEPKEPKEPEEPKVLKSEISVGDMVRIRGQLTVGEVSKIKGDNIEVLFGSFALKQKKAKLEKVGEKSNATTSTKFTNFNINDYRASASSELDLRGKRAEAAIPEVTNFMDKALMAAIPTARIVHGKGDGILREIVRNELLTYPEVGHFEDEHADRGGSGVTIVTFKK